MLLKTLFLRPSCKGMLVDELVEVCTLHPVPREKSSPIEEHNKALERIRPAYATFCGMAEEKGFINGLLSKKGSEFDPECLVQVKAKLCVYTPLCLEDFVASPLVKPGTEFYPAAVEFLRAYLQQTKRSNDAREEYECLSDIAQHKNYSSWCTVFFSTKKDPTGESALKAKIKMALVKGKFLNLSVEQNGKRLRVIGKYCWNTSNYIVAAYSTSATAPNQNQCLQ